MKYTVNYLADVDVTIEADSPEQAKELAKKGLGEFENRKLDYVYLSEVNFITKDNGTTI